MINYDEFGNFLRNSTNFASADNFDAKLSIIEETLGLDKHTMLMWEDFQSLGEVYRDLAPLEIADLIDFWENERSYGGQYKKR